MTAAETRPQPIIRPDSEEETGRLRPLDRRILQAIALVCAVSAILVIQWKDERNNVQKNLKPPEKVTSVREGQIGELVGAQWKVMGRQTARPLTGGDGNDVVELRMTVAVRPGDAASAKSVDSYGLTYRFLDDEGREWSALGIKDGAPRPGVPMRVTVRGTVPRTKADSLDLQVRPPKLERKQGEPLVSLRFEH
ncbi:hypothetical protein [Actinomadura chibensis]|uniref:Uncharacterized protein n=1 Tax=Actinomadura chibensis TaxID=392828 RepID=A0A5D0N8X3_9ACTN|nr:hypothetical protein [Actinomadura chibensis]TYB40863.1 hypothetical protein FXF69_38280 [Actinomadura chibensis]